MIRQIRNTLQVLFFIFIIGIILLAPLQASEKYTFENAERLKSRINWRDYNPEAFLESINDNKPIFLLLTAPSWCYWCQVYESEDYLFHPSVVSTINRDYVPIYVDADQRQDLTRQYLESGWPSTTVMTPSRERIFGFSGVRPPENMVINLNEASEFVSITGFSNRLINEYNPTDPYIPSQLRLEALIDNYESSILHFYDATYGGFGVGQKFPQPRTLDFALDLYKETDNQSWLNLVENTLENHYTNSDELQTNYNLFDPIDGGFHRYGTSQHWSPPHYEKMLYDNAKLLKTYSHLKLISPENEFVNEVVQKTEDFMTENWWDKQNGGFYGNSDVHGEDAYFGEVNRSENKPRVEKTKYSDWNSEAIITYAYLWQELQVEDYRNKAIMTLDFFQNNMIGENGAYHFYKEDGTKGVTGSLLDNAYLLLAFTYGYEVFGDKNYLTTANNLADYMLENLYDWNSGGFFERNSNKLDLYAPGDNVLLTYPYEENGIASMALVQLYTQTSNLNYLNAGLKSIGKLITYSSGNLDREYYYAKSADYILSNDLLTAYTNAENQITKLEEQALEHFWLNEPEPTVSDFQISNEGIDQLEGSFTVLFLVSLLAGLLSFLSPCTLPILPAFFAFTLKSSKKNMIFMNIAFFTGLAIIFVLLGISSALVGNFLQSQLGIFTQITGLILALVGVYMLLSEEIRLHLINLVKKLANKLKIPTNKVTQEIQPNSYLNSFLFGGAMGISWTPCVGPILVSVLLLASTTESVVTGGSLLFAYSIGLSIPFTIIAFLFDKIDKKGKVWSFLKGKEITIDKKYTIHTNNLLSGTVFVILGFLIFSGALIRLNALIEVTDFQIALYNFEEWMLESLQ